jgi:hypothetical protein
MNRLNSLTLFILLLSALTYSIIEWRSESIEQDTISADRQRPDFIAENYKVKFIVILDFYLIQLTPTEWNTILI